MLENSSTGIQNPIFNIISQSMVQQPNSKSDDNVNFHNSLNDMIPQQNQNLGAGQMNPQNINQPMNNPLMINNQNNNNIINNNNIGGQGPFIPYNNNLGLNPQMPQNNNNIGFNPQMQPNNINNGFNPLMQPNNNNLGFNTQTSPNNNFGFNPQMTLPMNIMNTGMDPMNMFQMQMQVNQFNQLQQLKQMQDYNLQLQKKIEENNDNLNKPQINENNIINNYIMDNNMENTIKIIFKKKQTEVLIHCNNDDLVSDVIQKYRTKANDNEQKLKFLYNAKELNNNLSVSESGIFNNSVVFVISTKISGA